MTSDLGEDARMLVRAACRRAPLDAAACVIAARLADPALLDTLLRVADTLRVRGLVLSRLVRDGARCAMPPEATETLEDALQLARRAVAAQDMERERVLARLRRAGVDVVLLKGAALRATLYSDPVERHAGDIDVLVMRSDVARALGALRDAGYAAPNAHEMATYERYHFHFRLAHPNGQVVELHWALTEPEALSQLDARLVFAAATELTRTQGAPVRVPTPAHMLLHLAAQVGVDPTRAFTRSVDVDRLIATGTIDWRVVTDIAMRGGFATATWLTLSLARDLHGAVVPPDVVEKLAPAAVLRGRLARLDVAARADGSIATTDGEARLLQLWVLAGDHGARSAARWLTRQGFLGPIERVRAESAPRLVRWREQTQTLAWLAATELATRLRSTRRPLRQRNT